jgi:hypothetical protein
MVVARLAGADKFVAGRSHSYTLADYRHRCIRIAGVDRSDFSDWWMALSGLSDWWMALSGLWLGCLLGGLGSDQAGPFSAIDDDTSCSDGCPMTAVA